MFGVTWGVVMVLSQLIGCLPEEVEVPRELTQAEIDELCKPRVDQKQDELGQAQDKVASLERRAAEQEGKVRDLEQRIAQNAEAGKAQRAELERLKSELSQTRELLSRAEAEKEQLLTDLKQTRQELDTRTEERDVAREDAVANRWESFLNDAQLEICEKGNRKKLGNCREAVQGALGTEARRDRFAHCIRSGQAEPSLREQANGEPLPQFSELLDEEVKEVKGWYVTFCDPTLPERTDARLAEEPLPR